MRLLVKGTHNGRAEKHVGNLTWNLYALDTSLCEYLAPNQQTSGHPFSCKPEKWSINIDI